MILLDRLRRLPNVRHAFFSRVGGVSDGIYDSKNCGFGSGDIPDNVVRNRVRCIVEMASGAAALVTAHQVHSADALVVEAPWQPDESPRADAMATDRANLALGILTAECAPVLLCDPQARVIGAAHAGWKGALGGVVESAVEAMAGLGARTDRVIAAIGPCIGRKSYEVGPEFRDRFLADDSGNARFFDDGTRPGHPLFDLKAYVAERLRRIGVAEIEVADHDTVAEEKRFFSYRRATLLGEADYGRCLSAIMIER